MPATRGSKKLRSNRNCSAPCWWSSCTNYWTTYSYDLLNRVTASSRRVGDSDPTLQTSSVYYEGLTTRTVDPQNKQSSKIANVLGHLARSIDHDGYFQTFEYDAMEPAAQPPGTHTTCRT